MCVIRGSKQKRGCQSGERAKIGCPTLTPGVVMFPLCKGLVLPSLRLSRSSSLRAASFLRRQFASRPK